MTIADMVDLLKPGTAIDARRRSAPTATDHARYGQPVLQDWYCDEVIPGHMQVDVVLDTETVLAFRPPRPGFGTEHIIVVPKPHVPSLLELEPDLALDLLAALRQVSALTVERYGGCQVLTSLGNEQHNRHLHWHVAVGEGVARFVSRGASGGARRDRTPRRASVTTAGSAGSRRERVP